ncbi:cytochrome b5-like [Mizuhopecten yessoensis]|uniref:Cytochrome b5 n=1 Tax=Mizuhopecten yessoensis TaxID=6573 RepID=A0A210PXV1_MIZYE|nr:cytochrome b5-like [Mizuhopecten yessoensis]OWF41320.1 Cytochrome b5 type B [Mizuhopecten yessoensis]
MQNHNKIQLNRVLSTAANITTAVMTSLMNRQHVNTSTTQTSTCGPNIEASTSLYSLKEVSDHCDTQSLWIVIHDKVYDVTQFTYEHPGGLEILLEHAGRDATVDFEEKGHSRDAYSTLTGYCIGELVQEDRRYKCVGDYRQKVPAESSSCNNC